MVRRYQSTIPNYPVLEIRLARHTTWESSVEDYFYLKLNDDFGKLTRKLTGLAKGLKNSHKLIELVATFRNLLFLPQAKIFCSWLSTQNTKNFGLKFRNLATNSMSLCHRNKYLERKFLIKLLIVFRVYISPNISVFLKEAGKHMLNGWNIRKTFLIPKITWLPYQALIFFS
jgi:hypothetical protein